MNRAATKATTDSLSLRNDAEDFDFPHHLERQYNLELVRMSKALDRQLKAAAKRALNGVHYERLAREAMEAVLTTFRHTELATRIVELFYAWVPIAWRSAQRATTIGQQVDVLRQQLMIEAMLRKQVTDYTKAFHAGETKFGNQAKKSANRAAFYSRDQSGHLYHRAAVKQAATDNYIGYIWLRTTSASPRDEHLNRVGKFFYFGQVGDEPGVLPNCKCGMRPVREEP